MDENPQKGLSDPVRVMQIIVFALTMGLLFFLAVVCLAAPGGMRGALDAVPLLTSIGLGLAVIMFLTRAIVLQVMTGNARRAILRGTPDIGPWTVFSLPSDRAAGQLVAFYQTRMIVSAAQMEGIAFFFLIAHFVERSPWSLVAAVVMIFGVASHFPTQRRVAGWVEQQMFLLQEERQLEPMRRE